MKTDSKLFTWLKDCKYGVTEASTIGLEPGKWPMNITVVSHRTGAEKTFSINPHTCGSHIVFYEEHGTKFGLRIIND